MTTPDFKQTLIIYNEPDTLKFLANQASRPGMVAFDLGSYVGLSSWTILPIIKASEGHLFCVDWFQGNKGPGNEDGEWRLHRYAEGDVVKEIQENLNPYLLSEVSVVIGTAHKVAPVVADGIADYVYIDTDHRYDTIKETILDWWPKVRPGGVLCGNAFDRPLSAGEEEQAWENRNIDHVGGIHYGITLAVTEIFPDVSVCPRIWWKFKDKEA